MYGCNEEDIIHYTCKRVDKPISIDGNLDKYPWNKAEKSISFVDLVTGKLAPMNTQITSLWDEKNLYIAFWIEEPNVQAKLTERDSLIYFENDVEVFIAGEDCYYEFQINALGTVYEVLYIWQDAYTKGSRFDTKEFDLVTKKVDVLGGFQDILRFRKHPRGARWAFMDWDYPGLKSAVNVQGTINNELDIDTGWTVELGFPWSGMKSLFGREIKPESGDTIRINFSRFNTPSSEDLDPNRHPGWSLTPHKIYDSHIPRCFCYVHLSD
jgi:hypothetical protein